MTKAIVALYVASCSATLVWARCRAPNPDGSRLDASSQLGSRLPMEGPLRSVSKVVPANATLRIVGGP
jgi:hypothetical protein